MLDNKNIFVIGSSGRIGSALCEKVLENKANLIMADINLEKNEELKRKLEAKFKSEILNVKINISSKSSINEAINAAKEKFGKIDAMVNSSYPMGKNWGKTPYYELEYEQICESLNLHLGGFILASQEFVKFFKNQGFGNIINLSSIMGICAPKFENYKDTNMQSSLEYSVIKAGINHLDKWLAKQLFNTNIRVNTLVSGGILDKQPQSFLNAYRNCCASKGMLEASDVCGAIVFLLSDNSKFINGQNIVVDDAWSL